MKDPSRFAPERKKNLCAIIGQTSGAPSTGPNPFLLHLNSAAIGLTTSSASN